MAIPIITDWQKYFITRHEGLGSSYERIMLNRKLDLIRKHYRIRSVIETPSFGFTGISGINSMDLARNGCKVTIEDHDPERIDLIRTIWQEVGLPLAITQNTAYSKLGYADKSFDLAWNFSAIWYVESLSSYLDELCRVTRKAILICIPNQTGWGMRMQMKNAHDASLQTVNLEYISEFLICSEMKRRTWKLVDQDYIDCPPWPDIGMNKEEFLLRIPWLKPILTLLGIGEKPPYQGRRDAGTSSHKTLSCLDHYKGKEPSFSDRMLRHAWFERVAPPWVKMYWAHHRYLLFTP